MEQQPCTICGNAIGALGTICLWREAVLCAACYARATAASGIGKSTEPPSILAPVAYGPLPRRRAGNGSAAVAGAVRFR